VCAAVRSYSFLPTCAALRGTETHLGVSAYAPSREQSAGGAGMSGNNDHNAATLGTYLPR